MCPGQELERTSGGQGTRGKPNKREFQILVALDDSSSISDNRSRSIALQSLATISSALALLEVGQLGVLRFVLI